MTAQKGSVRRTPRRVWTVILVPPKPGAPTRQVRVSMRSITTVAVCALAVVAAAGTWGGENSTLAAASTSRLAESQRTVVALLDSMQTLRAAALRVAHLPPQNMIMPVVGQITSPFSQSRLHPILGFFRAHLGVDLSAPAGTHIVAPAAARVKSVGWHLAYGLTIELEHSGDVVTRFAHCRAAYVHVGDTVQAGQVIGAVGTSGLTTGPHVHFEVLVHGKQVDPVSFVASSREPEVPADVGNGGEDK
jgi:murein DD-endopeptidase MepM/ murein hydrolase activator NlpD